MILALPFGPVARELRAHATRSRDHELGEPPARVSAWLGRPRRPASALVDDTRRSVRLRPRVGLVDVARCPAASGCCPARSRAAPPQGARPR